jgi:hypothetical protein
VFFEYYKIPEDYCQRPGEYLSGVLMFCGGDLWGFYNAGGLDICAGV